MTGKLLILAMLAAPAHATPLDAIADDLAENGLHWVDGVGFRPVDGWEHVAPKEKCIPGLAWKDMETDSVKREWTCPDVLKWMGGEWAYAPEPGAWYPVAYTPGVAAYQPGVTPWYVTPWYVTPWYVTPWYGGDSSCGCPPEDEVEKIPEPVPVPASVWFMVLVIVVMLWGFLAKFLAFMWGRDDG